MSKATLAIVAAALTAMATAPALVAQQQDFSAVKHEVHKLSDTVYMLEGVGGFAGGNIGVSAGEDGILIIDDQFAPLADKIKAALHGIKSGKVDYVLNTHWHFDHVGGNEVFGMEAAIIAHDQVRARMKTGAKVATREVPPAPKVALPVITYRDSVSLHWNGEEIHAAYYPSAHTDGDSIVWFKGSNVVHMGDQFFNLESFPFVDLDSGGSAIGLRDNIAKVLAKVDANTKIIPGHGPLATRADLERFHTMLVETITHVEAGMKSGKTLDELKAAGVPPQWASRGDGGFIRTPQWVESIYRSLQKK